ncbi:MAG: hypothetical protein AAFU49_01480 [Pseudomonadota bacterium]
MSAEDGTWRDAPSYPRPPETSQRGKPDEDLAAGPRATAVICGIGTETEAESLDALQSLISGPLAGLSAEIDGDRPLGIGLRLSARALETAADPGQREGLRRLLGEARTVPVSANGFAPGPLLPGRVKERVFLPDWLAEERLHYTTALGELMAEIAPIGHVVSVTTAPGADRALGKHDETLADIADGLLRAAAHFSELERRTGRRAIIAVQPVPGGVLETAEEAAAFFERWLFGPTATRRFAALSDLPPSRAAEALPAHIGVCLDTAAMAVMDEDASGALNALRRVGVSVAKVLIGAAIRFDPTDTEARYALARMELDRHRHPVVGALADGTSVRFEDLAAALEDVPTTQARGIWRVYRKVPLAGNALDPSGALVRLTEPAETILALHRKAPVAREIEIESVVPPRDPGYIKAMRADMAWVQARVGSTSR